MKVRVYIRLKPGVLDVQGKAIETGLANIDVNNISSVRVGKIIEFGIRAESKQSAQAQIEAICNKLFANPVIEDYEISFI